MHSSPWLSFRIRILALSVNFPIAEDTARYMGLLLAPVEGFGLCPRLFCPFGQKMAFYALLAILGNFWSSVVNLVTLNSVTLVKKRKM